MNTKLLIILVLLLITTGAFTKQCYQCSFCPRPFKGNEAGVLAVNVGDNEYCFKRVAPIIGTEERGNGGSGCTPIDKIQFCCKNNLCNGSITATLSVKLLATTASLLFVIRFFH